MLSIAADRLAALASNRGHVFAVSADSFAASAANLGHMIPIATDHFATLTTSLTGFVRGEFVCCPLLMCSTPALAGDLSLFVCIHGCKSPLTRVRHDKAPCNLPACHYR
jgi:hypothetical protein